MRGGQSEAALQRPFGISSGKDWGRDVGCQTEHAGNGERKAQSTLVKHAPSSVNIEVWHLVG